METPRVLVSITGDPVSIAHLKLIEAASRYGVVTVGVMEDEACQGHRQLPAQTTQQRLDLFQSFRDVSEVVRQHTWSHASIIRDLKPNYFIHSGNWDFSHGDKVRLETLEALESYGGKLVEIPHSKDVPYDFSHAGGHGLPEARRGALASLLTFGRCLKFIESHSPMSAMIIEKYRRVTDIQGGPKNALEGYDGLWSSSLTDSTLRGVADTEKLDFSQRMNNISEMFNVTSLPLIYDADTGGHTEHFIQNIRTMESLGVSACIVEDKTGLKRNSLFGNDVTQTQEDPYEFSSKITEAVGARTTKDFLIFARIESLILEKGLKDAETRANMYVEAGASGIMIHSRDNKDNEIDKFVGVFKENHPDVPLVVVPTGFNHVTVDEFEQKGVDIVIFANHMLRASHSAMQSAAESILRHGRTQEVDSRITSVSDTLKIIG